MTRFQFTLIMKTLLTILYLRLNNNNSLAWEKAGKDYEDLRSMFSLWQNTHGDEY